ncbi:MAG: NYN domain-containing protein [Cyanobacteria bacterium P01_E01_bin.6]
MPSSTPPNARLFVDGYNMIGAWSFLKASRDQHGLEAARYDLIEALSEYATFQGFETEIVFDAQYNRSVASRESVNNYLWVAYTDHNQTADTYIEKSCARFHTQINPRHHRLIVATSDRVQRLTVVGYGAECMSAAQLLSDIEWSRQRIKQKLRTAQKPNRKRLSNTIDPVVQKRLAQMRFGMTGK